MAGRLSTHVLDTTRGCPASGMTIELWRLDPAGNRDRLLKTVRTNADGRPDELLLGNDELVVGIYELVFAVGEYFAAQGVTSTAIPFLLCRRLLRWQRGTAVSSSFSRSRAGTIRDCGCEHLVPCAAAVLAVGL